MEQKGNGEISIPFDENNEEQQRKLAQKIVDAAKADGIKATCNNVKATCVKNGCIKESSELVLSFPNVTETQLKKYYEML
jgi:hypothetical protein